MGPLADQVYNLQRTTLWARLRIKCRERAQLATTSGSHTSDCAPTHKSRAICHAPQNYRACRKILSVKNGKKGCWISDIY